MRFFLSSAAHGVIGNGYPRPATSPKVESGVPSVVVVGGGGAPSPRPRPRPPPPGRRGPRLPRKSRAEFHPSSWSAAAVLRRRARVLLHRLRHASRFPRNQP